MADVLYCFLHFIYSHSCPMEVFGRLNWGGYFILYLLGTHYRMGDLGLVVVTLGFFGWGLFCVNTGGFW